LACLTKVGHWKIFYNVQVPKDEQQMIAEIRQGRRDTFREVFDAHYESLCRYAFTLLKDMNDAEDVVQAVFVKIWEKREEVEIRFALRAYLYKTVYHQCLNHLEHRVVRQKHQLYGQQQMEKEVALPAAFADEMEVHIANAVNTLPPQCKAVFMMSRYDELKHAEIADQLGISVNTVQNQISKALGVLRAALKTQVS
jgi:RNA polymerase sigma-70 factor (ECF subfamily)